MRISRGVPLLFTAALLLACGDDDAASSATLAAVDADGATSTTAETTTTAGEADAELKAEIEQAYYAQWDAYVEILSDPDPTNPLIDKHFAAAAKETLLDAISRDLRDGVITRLPENDSNFRPKIESIDIAMNYVTVTECLVDGLVAVRRSSGEVLDDDVVVLRLVNRFERIDGSWKVTATRLLEELSGRDQCAVS